MPTTSGHQFLSRTSALVLAGVLTANVVVGMFTPSRPYFVAPWHMALSIVLLSAALIAAGVCMWPKLYAPARTRMRWKTAFWMLWLASVASLAPAVQFHLSQANYPPLVRLLSFISSVSAIMFILLHLFKIPAQDAPKTGAGHREET